MPGEAFFGIGGQGQSAIPLSYMFAHENMEASLL